MEIINEKCHDTHRRSSLASQQKHVSVRQGLLSPSTWISQNQDIVENANCKSQRYRSTWLDHNISFPISSSPVPTPTEISFASTSDESFDMMGRRHDLESGISLSSHGSLSLETARARDAIRLLNFEKAPEHQPISQVNIDDLFKDDMDESEHSANSVFSDPDRHLGVSVNGARTSDRSYQLYTVPPSTKFGKLDRQFVIESSSSHKPTTEHDPSPRPIVDGLLLRDVAEWCQEQQDRTQRRPFRLFSKHFEILHSTDMDQLQWEQMETTSVQMDQGDTLTSDENDLAEETGRCMSPFLLDSPSPPEPQKQRPIRYWKQNFAAMAYHHDETNRKQEYGSLPPSTKSALQESVSAYKEQFPIVLERDTVALSGSELSLQRSVPIQRVDCAHADDDVTSGVQQHGIERQLTQRWQVHEPIPAYEDRSCTPSPGSYVEMAAQDIEMHDTRTSPQEVLSGPVDVKSCMRHEQLVMSCTPQSTAASNIVPSSPHSMQVNISTSPSHLESNQVQIPGAIAMEWHNPLGFHIPAPPPPPHDYSDLKVRKRGNRNQSGIQMGIKPVKLRSRTVGNKEKSAAILKQPAQRSRSRKVTHVRQRAITGAVQEFDIHQPGSRRSARLHAKESSSLI